MATTTTVKRYSKNVVFCFVRADSQLDDSCRCLSIYYVHLMNDVTIC